MMKLLDSIWAMGRKWRITTGEVYKYETHLKAHGGQQVQGIYYWDTYAPVVTWFEKKQLLDIITEPYRWSCMV